MGDSNDKTVTMNVKMLAGAAKTIVLNIEGCHTIRSVVERNHRALMGREAPVSANTWNEIGNTKEIRELAGWMMTMDGEKLLMAADLFPTADVDKYWLLWALPVRSDETIEQYVGTLFNLENSDALSKEQLTNAFHHTKTRLVLRQTLEKSQSFISRPITSLFFPSQALQEISKPALNYYNKFLERFIANQIMLHNCLALSKESEEPSVRECARHWLEDQIYQLHISFLSLFVIPEVFLRINFQCNYGLALQKLKFENPWGEKQKNKELAQKVQEQIKREEEDSYFIENMAGRSLSGVFTSLLKAHKISTFEEYIVICQQPPTSDFASFVLNTLRIYLNKTKHASGVQIIRSRPAREQKAWRLKGIKNKLQKLQDQGVGPSDERYRYLKLDEEYEQKVSYSFEDYNFADSDFVRSNGISILVDDGKSKNANPHFVLTLGDMEMAIKILAGAMCILANATNKKLVKK